jgi:molybdate/tungstate transport system substrate-binding protein
VIGYNPNSKFAADLRSKPWYQVITESGFKLGSTGPRLDPKGQFGVQALTSTANIQASKKIFAEQVRHRAPLVRTICRARQLCRRKLAQVA